jgi:nitric oxide reductase activation protein
MGWESFRSEWDDPIKDQDDDKDDKKSSENLGWWGQFHDDDEKSSDQDRYNADSFSYKRAFDDSADSWYRQSSFKYSKYSDYSPSSLFRSSFVGFARYASSGDNEAKNKAIRALRVLTRNANTLVDAGKKISYDVQFSNGTDSNGVTANLLDGKKRAIFVSPDKLVGTKTVDEEDAVIDALTGFVLLRVQISQSVAQKVITKINKLSIQTLPSALAAKVREAAASSALASEDAKNISAEFIDSYLAGVLAKSLLTRLCRREVVTDWGGFAPYFVRHAKQFATTREKLEADEISVETLVARIAYNMIADESEIAIAADINGIVEKNLGDKLEHDEILPACQLLIADLRKHLAAKGEPESGAFENALTAGLEEMLEKIKKEKSCSAEDAETMRNNMGDFADLLDGLYENRVGASANTDALNELENIEKDLYNTKYKEKLLKNLRESAKRFESAAEVKTPENDIRYWQRTLEQTIAHFDAQITDLNKAGVKQDIFQEKYAEIPAPERFKKQAADLRNFIKEASKLVKDEMRVSRERAAAALQKIADEMPNTQNLLEAIKQQAHDCRAKLQETAEKFSEVADVIETAELIAKLTDSKLANLAQVKSNVEELQNKTATIGKTASGLQSFCSSSRRRFAEGLGECRSTTDRISRSGGRSWPFQNFINDAASGHYNFERGDAAKIDSWHESAIDNFMAQEAMSDAGFQATTAAAANPELFEILRKMFENTGMPAAAGRLDEAVKTKFEATAAGLGMSSQELLDELNAAEKAKAANHADDADDAKNLGKMLREKFDDLAKLSPVDEQLFGETVERKTKILNGEALTQVNDEARNAAEEEYVAYLDNADSTKPKLRVKPPLKNTTPWRAITHAIRTKNKAAIEKIRSALRFQGTKRTGEVHGMLSGDLDEGSLHKLRYDSEHIWSQKLITKLPDVAVGILVDQSGSMSGGKIEQAREMCVLLAEAVKKIDGVHLHIYGHTANQASQADLVLFEHYSSYGPAASANLDGLGSIAAHANNYDGYAIKETAKLLDKDPAKRKYLFVISDGLPHGSGYAGDEAKKHVTSVCSFVRNRLKIPTYAFAVGVPEYDYPAFEEQYGKDNIVFLSTVRQCLPQIVRFLRNALHKEKNLVDVTAD